MTMLKSRVGGTACVMRPRVTLAAQALMGVALLTDCTSACLLFFWGEMQQHSTAQHTPSQ